MNYGDIALQIGVLLFALSFHEMAHAWHDQVVTFKDPEILAAYHAAV